MNSKAVIIDSNKNSKKSQLVTALKELKNQVDAKDCEIKGQFNQTVIIQTGNVTIKNSELDCEFTIPFDDDIAANTAEITVYNLSDNTINQIKNQATITVTAGYGNDTGIIFSGYISSKKSYWNDLDRITEIRAIDDKSRYNQTIKGDGSKDENGNVVTSISYSAGKKASYILKDLVEKVGLPVAVFKVSRDYTYKDEVSVDGSLSDAIKQYATVCGVSAYVCKQKIYVRPLKDGDNTHFKLSADTGLLSVSEFEETSDKEEYKDTIRGFEIECLLQHRLQTASIIELSSKNYSGSNLRVREGSHNYDGSNFTTKAKIIQV